MNIATKKSSVDFDTARHYRLIPSCAGTVTMAVGGLVLVGWLLGMRSLLSVMPGYVTMKPNTAFCFVLGGLALWLLRFSRSRHAVRLNPKHHQIGQVCALLLVFVGLLTLGEYFCQLNLRIDQALLPDTLTDARVLSPGRMSISTAIGFCILGSSLFFLGTKHARGAMTSQILAVIGLAEVMIAFLGYVYGVEGLYATTFYATMAIHTTLLFGFLFVGILFARADDGLMSVITDRHSGGQMARFFLPLAFTVPFLVGWLRLKGQQAGLYGTEFGLTLFATSNIVIFTTLVWLSAKWQNTRAVQLAGSENEFRTMLDAIPQLAWIARADGYIYWYNQQWYDYTNTTLEQMQGDGWASVHDPAVLPFVVERWHHCLLTGEPFEFEFPLKGSDGHFRWFLTRCFPLKGGDGKILRWFGTNTDISQKREAEEEIRLLNTGLEKRVMERTEELVAAKARLQDVLDAATHVAVIAANPEGIITVFNSGAEQMLGYTSEEMVGKQLPNIFHLASETITRGLELTEEMGRPVEGFDVFVEKARNGRFEEREWTYVRKDGSHLSVNLVVTAQQDAAGETTGFLGVAMDVTARKKSEETLRVSEERFRLIVDAVKDYALFMLDQDGHVVSWNAGAERIKGYKEAEIIGKHFSCLYLPEDIQAGHPEEGLRIAAQQGRYSQEGWRVRKDGTPFFADVVITAIHDNAGELRGYAKVTRDITERKKVEKALQHQARLLDMANDTIFIRDGEDRITYWNQGAQRLYGWSKEEALGRITHSLLNTQFPQPFEEIKAQVLAKGHWEGELVHTRRDGAEVIVASGWTLQRDESNRTTSIIEMNYDITARKKAEHELEESRERLNAILNGSVDGIIVYESVRDEAGGLRDFRFSMVNPATEKLIGQNASDLLGHTLLEKFPNVVTDGLFEKFARIVDKNETLDFEHLSSESDSARWYRLAGVKLGDGLAVSFSEISTRKRYEQQLQEAKEHAELTDSAKSDFLANMSHEIRTPMNGVIGMTGLLLDTNLDTEQRRLAETTRNSAESLLTLINDILDFSKIEAGQMVFEEIDFDLRKLVEDTLEMMAGQAQAKGIELVGGIGPEVATKLRGDPGRVHQLLTNLISNAIKFTPSGEVAARVTTEMETERDVFVRIEIKDTGIGIRPEIQDRLFQSFVQGDSSTSRKFGGTGLGLAICKRLAEAMNGNIGVESAPAQGSKFWVTMRISRQIAAKTSPQFVPEFSDSRVLIVDDNETSRLFLHKQIVDWQLRDGCASTGEEALAILRQAVAEEAPFSVAIIDLQMPVLDGLALIRKINADPQLGATKLILLIPFGRSFDAGELKAVNIAACCIKPVRQSALLDCLVQVLARSTSTGATFQTEPFIRSHDFPKPRSERVLLAEDNVVNQEVALGNLRKLGYNADVVANGFEVLDALKRKRYDIILMDCQMPELDGYKTTKEIRRREQKDHRTWIIAMTANVMVGDREKCIAAGMDDYVSKPSRRTELRSALDRVATTAVGQLDDDDVLRTLIEDGEDVFDRLVGLFIASAPSSVADMKRALAKADSADLVRSAHNLKGSCSNFGGSSLRELCTQIEQGGPSGRPSDIANLIVSVEKELAKLIETLRTYRKAGHP